MIKRFVDRESGDLIRSYSRRQYHGQESLPIDNPELAAFDAGPPVGIVKPVFRGGKWVTGLEKGEQVELAKRQIVNQRLRVDATSAEGFVDLLADEKAELERLRAELTVLNVAVIK